MVSFPLVQQIEGWSLGKTKDYKIGICGFPLVQQIEGWSLGNTKDYKIGMCGFPAQHAALWSKRLVGLESE